MYTSRCSGDNEKGIGPFSFEAKSIISFLMLTILAFLGNFFALPLHFGANYLFGSIFLFLILHFYGCLPALIASGLAATATLKLWGHPYAIIVFTAEFLFVGYIYCRMWKRNLFNYVVMYWVLVGMPLTYVLYKTQIGLSNETIIMICLKQTSNGIANVVLANLIIYYIPVRFQKMLTPTRTASIEFKPTMQQIMTIWMIGIILFPALLSLILQNRSKANRMPQQILDIAKNEISKRTLLSSQYFDERVKEYYALKELISDTTESQINLPQDHLASGYMADIMADGTIRPIAPYSIKDFQNPPKKELRAEWISEGKMRISLLEDSHDNSVYIFVPDPIHSKGGLIKIPSEVLKKLLTDIPGEKRVLQLINTFEPLAETEEFQVINYTKTDELYAFCKYNISKSLSELKRWETSTFHVIKKLTATDNIYIDLKLPMETFIADLRHHTSETYAAILIPILLSSVAISILARFLTRPLTALTKFAVNNEEGKEISLDKIDKIYWPSFEIDKLARSLSLMVRSMRAQQLEQTGIASDLTALIDTANAPIFGIDAEGKVKEWNQTAERITGYSKDEVVGRGLVDNFITEEYKASVKEVLDKALAGEQTDNFEFPLYTKCGDRVDVLLNSTTRRDASGAIVGVVGVGQDITELTKVQLEQTRIASDLTALIDTANAPIFGIDAEGKVNEWNQTAERINGYSKDEVMGRGLVDNFITDEYKASVKEVLDKALAGEQTANYEFPLYTKGGDRVDVLLNATTRRDEYGRVTGVVGVGQDITERTQFEKDLKFERDNLEKNVKERTDELKKLVDRVEKTNELLKEADRHKSQFLSSMSHELRTPLNSILGFTDLLKGKFFGDLNDKQLGYVVQINESGHLLLELITDLLELAKIDSGIVDLELTELNPEELVKSSISLVNYMAKRKNINIETKIDKNLGAVLGDLRRSKQIILNLLTNAVKYSEQNGVIHVNVHRQNDLYIRFEIIDYGVGIETGELGKIFTEFHQIDRRRDEALGGTGIGLSLAKRLVELQNGHIGVKSELEKGSKFWFTLPSERFKKFTKSIPVEQSNMRKHTPSSSILLAEDNEVNLRLVLDMLSVDQHEVVVAKNGKEALDLAQTFLPDLILMDMQMPVMDGFEATKAIRKVSGFSTTPIIGLTASADKDSVKSQFDAGCTDHLAKPVTTEMLFDILNKYLGSD